jgi:hypothetical protein
MIRRTVSSLAKSGLRWRVQTVRKMIIDLNPTATVGKCAGLFLYGLWRGELREPFLPGRVRERSLGVAELRPPFLSDCIVAFEDSLLPAQQRKWRVNSTMLQQAEHHRTRTFREEYLELLRRSGVEFDERYV